MLHMALGSRASRLLLGVGVALAASSMPLAVGAAVGVNLSFTTLPPNPVTAGAAFPVTDHVQDNAGASLGGVLVILDIPPGNNPSAGTLTCGSGTSRVTNGSGNALFTGCRINRPGAGYALRASASGAASVVTPTFTVRTGPPAALAFTSYPANPTGVNLTPQPAVAIVDAAGNVVTTATRTITLTTNRHLATFSCTGGTSRAAVNGVATFGGCLQTTPDTGYRLTANDGPGGLAPVTGPLFRVTGAPARLRLCWGPAISCRVAPPANPFAGTPFAVQPSIRVTDAAGNLIVGDSTTSITLSILAGTPASGGPGTLSCANGLTRTVVQGIANFAGCMINTGGVGYRLNATSSPPLSPATSNAFNVGASAPLIILSTSPSPGVIRWGETASLMIHFVATNGAGKTFQLQASHDQAAWFTVATLTTNATGDAAFPYRPSDNRYYRVWFAGTADLAAAVSATVRIVVRQLNLLRPTNLRAVRVVAAGTGITFTSTVRPARPELPRAHVNFVVYRLVSGHWTLALSQTIGVDSFGSASLRVTFSTSGKFYVRSQAVPTTLNANSGWSPLERYDVT